MVPVDAGCWSYTGERVVIDLNRVPELAHPNGAIRIEGKGLTDRILVVHGQDGEYHAFRNRCLHAGRRLDPVPGTETIQCCSIGKMTYDMQGTVVHGTVDGSLTVFEVHREDNHLAVTLVE